MDNIRKERTLVVIKPDGVQRTLVGEIIKRYEQLGLKLTAMKMMVATPAHIEKHYTLDPNWKRIVAEKAIESYQKKGIKPPSTDPIAVGNKVVAGLKKYMTSG